MDYVNLGRTGLQVSRICLGCMTYGAPATGALKAGRHAWALNETESNPFLRQALDLGINFFDTANVYSSGASEEVLGRFLKANVRRESVVIATKVHGIMRDEPNGRGLSRKVILFGKASKDTFVSEIMTPDPLTVQADASVREAARIMREHHIGGLPVLKGTLLVGMVTDSDLLALLSTRPPSEDLWLPSPLEIIEVPIREFINWEKTKSALADIGTMPVSRVMSEPPITIGGEAAIEDAAALMLREGIVRLPVVRDSALVGIVTRSDIVQGLAVRRELTE